MLAGSTSTSTRERATRLRKIGLQMEGKEALSGIEVRMRRRSSASEGDGEFNAGIDDEGQARGRDALLSSLKAKIGKMSASRSH